MNRSLPVFAAALLLAAPGVRAQEMRATVRALGLWTDSSRHEFMDSHGFVTNGTTEMSSGPALALEIRPNSWFGIDLTGLWSGVESDFTSVSDSPLPGPKPVFTAHYDVDFWMPSLGFSVHPFPGHRWDLGIGPFGGPTFFSTSSRTVRDVSWGGALTLDVPLGTGLWALSAHARYIDLTIPEGFGSPERRIDGWWTGGGLAYRFGRR